MKVSVGVAVRFGICVRARVRDACAWVCVFFPVLCVRVRANTVHRPRCGFRVREGFRFRCREVEGEVGGLGAEVDGGLEELDSFCSSVFSSSVMTAVACWIRIMDCSCCTSIACSLVFMLVTSKMWLLDSHLLTTFSPARSNVRSLAMRHACVVGCTPRARGDLPVVRDMKSSQDELPLEQLHVMHAGTRFHTSDKYPEGNPDLAITGRKWSMVVALPPQYTHLRPEATPLTHTIDFFGSAGVLLVLLSSKAKEELALCTHLQDKLHTRFMAWAARDIVTNAALYLPYLNRDCSP